MTIITGSLGLTGSGPHRGGRVLTNVRHCWCRVQAYLLIRDIWRIATAAFRARLFFLLLVFHSSTAERQHWTLLATWQASPRVGNWWAINKKQPVLTHLALSCLNYSFEAWNSSTSGVHKQRATKFLYACCWFLCVFVWRLLRVSLLTEIVLRRLLDFWGKLCLPALRYTVREKWIVS